MSQEVGPDAPTDGSSTGFSRRAIVGSMLAVAGGAAAGFAGGRVTADGPQAAASRIEPFHGARQAGIATPQQAHAMFVSVDLTTPDVTTLRELLAAVTATAAAITRGDPPPARPGRPAGTTTDTDFATGIDPARLTVTIGVGPGVFALPGLASLRPAGLATLPSFAGDALDERWSGGDVIVQLCADDQQVVSHAFRSMRAALPGLGRIRWTQHGFISVPPGGGTPRNMLGQPDGTANPRAGTPEFDEAVWAPATGEPAWFAGGTYLVYRKIRLRTANWDLTPRDEQDLVIGRRRSDGAPLTGRAEFDEPDLEARSADGQYVIPADAHVRLVRGMAMLRRSYTYDYGWLLSSAGGFPDPLAAAEAMPHDHADGEQHDDAGGMHGNHDRLDAGTLFCCYVSHPDRFVGAQQALATDRLNAFTQHTASAIFAIPPGAHEGESIAAALTAL
jgi:deferrochelatase/peroxidase EfeB